MGINIPVIDTPLYGEMYMALELLGITHAEFIKIPELERKKILSYLKVKAIKDKKVMLEQKERFQRQTQQMKGTGKLLNRKK